MNLLLWRHATTNDPEEGQEAILSSRGRRQAALVASWLQSKLPADYSVLVSPTLHTQQTARALTDEFELCEDVGPAATPASILAAVAWPNQRGTMIVVGHQPTLGRIASFLLFGSEVPVSIKKGALWWIASRDREDRLQNVLRAVITPDLL